MGLFSEKQAGLAGSTTIVHNTIMRANRNSPARPISYSSISCGEVQSPRQPRHFFHTTPNSSINVHIVPAARDILITIYPIYIRGAGSYMLIHKYYTDLDPLKSPRSADLEDSEDSEDS